MHSKTFTADSPDAVIKAVNDWLAGETGIAVRRTETRPPEPKAGEPIEFCIWYDQEGTP
jgi:hypothetical protein